MCAFLQIAFLACCVSCYSLQYVPPLDPQKTPAEKGDPNCTKFWEDQINDFFQGQFDTSFEPCRIIESDQNIDIDNDMDYSSDDDDVYGHDESARPYPGEGSSPSRTRSNSVRFNVFVSVPPTTFSLGYILSTVVTMYLNVTSPDYSVQLRKAQEEDASRSAEFGLLFDEALKRINLIVNSTRKNVTADMFLVDFDPAVISMQRDLWWWRYQLRYDVFVPNSSAPVYNTTELRLLRRECIQTLNAGMALVRSNLLDQYGVSIPEKFTIQLERPDLPPTAEQGPQTGDRISPVDTNKWDWRRCFGLAMFLVTFGGTLCLVQIADVRRRRRTNKQLWGNLATEEGVEELLSKGWAIQDNKIVVFNKKKVGYRDDSSILNGGFEQNEGIVDCEVTVTHPSSETTPETRTS
jgi:hypothetical protein